MGEGSGGGGLVVLTGAGPGEPLLATAAAIRWISRADVVVYDRLVGPELLGHCRPGAETIYVGKTPGGTGPDQQWINELLLRRGRAGQLVVRLKGGDPFVFGRGGEEAAALAAAGVPYRIVPGVTAALAAAAYAGIPLTDRSCASTVAFVTGQEAPGKGGETIDFRALAGMDTIVLYMGVRRLGAVAQALIDAGRDPASPAAIVASVSTPDQRTLTAPLCELAAKAAAAGVGPPALTIIGDVVSLRERLAWYEKLPLFGQTVLVTRPAAQAAALAEPLAERGAAVLVAPAIEIAPPEDFSAADESLRRLGETHVVAFTSVNGVAAFADRCRHLGLDARALAGARVAAVGPATAEALARRFLRPDILPERFTTAALGEAIVSDGPVAGRRILLVRADVAGGELSRPLIRAGADVVEVAFYRTVRPAALPEPALEALRRRRVDCVTFTSASSVTHFLDLIAQDGLEAPGAVQGIELAAIGPATARALASAGLTATVVADPHTVPALVEAVTAALG